MTKSIGVGIVGCGQAVQTLHIPAFRHLPDKFFIAGLNDASPSVTTRLAETIPGAKPYASYEALLNDPAVDVVLVASPSALHATHALQAMRAGKHVLIEKPMCSTLEEASELEAAERETGRIALVGYMRRHAGAFKEAVALIEPLRGEINFARVRDIVGQSPAFMNSITAVIRGDDVPDAEKKRLDAVGSAALKAAIGTDENPLAGIYNTLLGLSSHDISAMRELIGRPQRVLSAVYRHGGRFISAVFDYGDFVCHFETGFDQIARFDVNLEVFTPQRQVRVDFDTTFIRHQPARLTVTEANTPTGVSTRSSYQTRQDNFILEWEYFHECLVTGRRPKTDIKDARQDIELFAEMMKLMAAQ